MFEAEALNELANRRRLETQRVEEQFAALKRDEHFCAAYFALKSAQFEYAKACAFNTDISAANVAKTEAQTAFNNYLVEHGMPLDILEEHPSCPICHDRGTVDGNNCSCLKELVRQLSIRDGDLPHVSSDFGDFDLSLYQGDDRKNALGVVSFAKKWTEQYPSVQTKILTIYGKTGVGKTHLAGILANSFIDKGFSVCFIKAYHLNDMFLRARLAPYTEKTKILADVIDADLLVVDDLGSEQPYQNVTLEYLYTTIAEREKRATILTTNLSPAMLAERYQERIYSRLAGGYGAMIPMCGKDLRINGKK